MCWRTLTNHISIIVLRTRQQINIICLTTVKTKSDMLSPTLHIPYIECHCPNRLKN